MDLPPERFDRPLDDLSVLDVNDLLFSSNTLATYLSMARPHAFLLRANSDDDDLFDSPSSSVLPSCFFLDTAAALALSLPGVEMSSTSLLSPL